MGNRLRRFLLNTARVIFVVVIAALVAPVHAQVDPRYQGEYRDGKKNGLGVYTFPGGNRYEGEFRDDKMNGRGVYTFTDGNRYEGEFRDGKRNGRGVFTFANRNRYEGEYRDDKFHGRGVFTFADGNRYEGEFRDDKFHGRGVFTFTSGDRFEGEFRDDKRNGRGVYTFASGTRDEGEYRNGNLFNGQRTSASGIVVVTYTNGERAIPTPGSAILAPPAKPSTASSVASSSQGGSSTPGSPAASAGTPSSSVRQPAAAAPEKGKGANPTLTVADLAACKKEIAELHRMDIAAARNSVQEYCTKLERDKYPDNCKNMTKGLQETSSMSDMNWFLKGNESCSGPEYPCWGLNSIETTAELLVNNVFPPTGEKFGDYGIVVQQCVARLWIAKRDGISPASAAAIKGGSKPSASSSTTVSPASSGNPSPASPASIAPAQAMSPQQIAACSEEIKRTQLESQGWSGNANDVAARLGRFQKDLFEGRCAGHPEAQVYIAGANKMLAYGGSGAGSGGAASGGTGSYIELKASPQCANYYVVSDKPATFASLHMFSFGIRNSCSFPVYIRFNGYINDSEHIIEYSTRLKRTGPSNNGYFGPGDKLEAIPFVITKGRRFYAKIHSVCPTEDEAARITGKRITSVQEKSPTGSGICLATVFAPSGVGAAQ